MIPPSLTDTEIAAAMNEWMRRFIEDPSTFDHEFQTVSEFLREDEPSYGRVCAAYLLKIHQDLTAAS